MSAPLDNGTYSIFWRFRLAGLESTICSGSGIDNGVGAGTGRSASFEVEVDAEMFSGKASAEMIGVEPEDGCREVGDPGPSLSSKNSSLADSRVLA